MSETPFYLDPPHKDLVLVRFTDFSAKDPYVMFRLWRKPVNGSGAGPTILEFMAPSDEEAEKFVAAWYNKTRFNITTYRYAWYQHMVELAEQAESRWHNLPGGSAAADMDQALEEYLTADHFEQMLKNAFGGRWVDDPNRDSLT